MSIVQHATHVPGQGSAAPAERVYDVTGFSTEIDLSALEVVRWAPCWMSRAERLLLFGLVFGLRPERYLEVGTFYGGSAAVVATAMGATGTPGRLVCVDNAPQIEARVWERIEHRTTLIVGESPAILERVAAHGPFDFALVDGDHSCEGVRRDVRGVLPLVGPGGHILCHDGYNDQVARALGEFVSETTDRVVDCGLLTREVSIAPDATGRPARYGGLRLFRVR